MTLAGIFRDRSKAVARFDLPIQLADLRCKVDSAS